METHEHILPKAIAIVGSTASGKTEWGLRLARELGGEVVSADSRQVYKEMDIGTAKPSGVWKYTGLRRVYQVDDVPHHLIDFLSPGKSFTTAEFRDKAIKCINSIHKQGKIPFVVGGAGLYIDALAQNFSIPRVPPNKKLRESFEEKTSAELLTWLANLDPQTARSIDPHNKRRIIRALEVCILSGTPFSQHNKRGEQLFDILKIGIVVPRDILWQRIDERIDRMMEKGLLDEVSLLVKRKYGWHLPSMSGVGYRQFKSYFEGTCTLDEVVQLLKRDTKRFAKRQATWFRRDKGIVWCTDFDSARDVVLSFLKK